jgi:hypothetical protein
MYFKSLSRWNAKCVTHFIPPYITSNILIHDSVCDIYIYIYIYIRIPIHAQSIYFFALFVGAFYYRKRLTFSCHVAANIRLLKPLTFHSEIFRRSCTLEACAFITWYTYTYTRHIFTNILHLLVLALQDYLLNTF